MSRLISVALLAVALVALGGCQSSADIDALRYSLDVRVGPADDDPSDVVCRVVLEDTATGEVVLKPVVFTSWGEPATITEGNETDGFVMTVMADNKTQSVEYSAQYHQNGKVVFESRAQVSHVVGG
ncbi:MAG: hypothetical protein WBM67_06145 [Sedimenticolaceae bacterium]